MRMYALDNKKAIEEIQTAGKHAKDSVARLNSVNAMNAHAHDKKNDKDELEFQGEGFRDFFGNAASYFAGEKSLSGYLDNIKENAYYAATKASSGWGYHNDSAYTITEAGKTRLKTILNGAGLSAIDPTPKGIVKISITDENAAQLLIICDWVKSVYPAASEAQTTALEAQIVSMMRHHIQGHNSIPSISALSILASNFYGKLQTKDLMILFDQPGEYKREIFVSDDGNLNYQASNELSIRCAGIEIPMGEYRSTCKIAANGSQIQSVEYENKDLADLFNSENPDVEFVKQYHFLKNAIVKYLSLNDVTATQRDSLITILSTHAEKHGIRDASLSEELGNLQPITASTDVVTKWDGKLYSGSYSTKKPTSSFYRDAGERGADFFIRTARDKISIPAKGNQTETEYLSGNGKTVFVENKYSDEEIKSIQAGWNQTKLGLWSLAVRNTNYLNDTISEENLIDFAGSRGILFTTKRATIVFEKKDSGVFAHVETPIACSFQNDPSKSSYEHTIGIVRAIFKVEPYDYKLVATTSNSPFLMSFITGENAPQPNQYSQISYDHIIKTLTEIDNGHLNNVNFSRMNFSGANVYGKMDSCELSGITLDEKTSFRNLEAKQIVWDANEKFTFDIASDLPKDARYEPFARLDQYTLKEFYDEFLKQYKQLCQDVPKIRRKNWAVSDPDKIGTRMVSIFQHEEHDPNSRTAQALHQTYYKLYKMQLEKAGKATPDDVRKFRDLSKLWGLMDLSLDLQESQKLEVSQSKVVSTALAAYNAHKAQVARSLKEGSQTPEDKRALVKSLIDLAYESKLPTPVDLTNLDLRGADLTARTGEAAPKIQHANFKGSDLRGAKFDGADLSDSNFRDAKLNETTSFNNATLSIGKYATWVGYVHGTPADILGNIKLQYAENIVVQISYRDLAQQRFSRLDLPNPLSLIYKAQINPNGIEAKAWNQIQYDLLKEFFEKRKTADDKTQPLSYDEVVLFRETADRCKVKQAIFAEDLKKFNTEIIIGKLELGSGYQGDSEIVYQKIGAKKEEFSGLKDKDLRHAEIKNPRAVYQKLLGGPGDGKTENAKFNRKQVLDIINLGYGKKFAGTSSDKKGADLSGEDLSNIKNFAAIKGPDGRPLAAATDFSYCTLIKTNFSKCDLRGVKFVGADLCGADLCGADLCGADLCGADLCGADLCGADLTSAIIDANTDFTNVTVDANTKLHDITLTPKQCEQIMMSGVTLPAAAVAATAEAKMMDTEAVLKSILRKMIIDEPTETNKLAHVLLLNDFYLKLINTKNDATGDLVSSDAASQFIADISEKILATDDFFRANADKLHTIFGEFYAIKEGTIENKVFSRIGDDIQTTAGAFIAAVHNITQLQANYEPHNIAVANINWNPEQMNASVSSMVNLQNNLAFILTCDIPIQKKWEYRLAQMVLNLGFHPEKRNRSTENMLFDFKAFKECRENNKLAHLADDLANKSENQQNTLLDAKFEAIQATVDRKNCSPDDASKLLACELVEFKRGLNYKVQLAAYNIPTPQSGSPASRPGMFGQAAAAGTDAAKTKQQDEAKRDFVDEMSKRVTTENCAEIRTVFEAIKNNSALPELSAELSVVISNHYTALKNALAGQQPAVSSRLLQDM